MKMKNKKFRRIFIYIIVMLIILLSLMINAGKFLNIGDPLHKSDAIIVLSGDRGERIEKAAELYHKGYSKYFVITGGIVYNDVTMAQLMREHAVELGIPESAIILEDKADSTYENAHFTRSKIKFYPIQSAIIVSSNYHMRRVKLIFDREFRNSKIKLTYVGAKDRDFDESSWWSSNKSIMLTLTEYIKLAGYTLGKNY